MTDQYEQPTESPQVPPVLAAFLDGTRLEDKVGTALGLATVDDDGWPRTAQLSAGETLLDADGTLRLAIWSRSATAANLARDGRVVLSAPGDGDIVSVTARVTEREPLTDPALSTFVGPVLEVRVHHAPYADVTHGIGFALHDVESTLARWARQVDVLRTR